MMDDDDGLRARRRSEMAPVTRSQDAPQETEASGTTPTSPHFSQQIIELATTSFLLAYGFVGPELRDQITGFGMGKDFVPERDIGSLDGKVILVTGGMYIPAPHPNLH
jgi:hypothetical protein